MKLSKTATGLTLCVALASSSAMADYPTVIGCAKGATPATLSLTLTATTSLEGCPLLEDKELRKLVDKFGAGTVFAYRAIPDTCLTGSGAIGTLTVGDDEYQIDGASYSESAQRLFPVPVGQSYPLAWYAADPVTDDLFGISDDGTLTQSGWYPPPTLQAGAAMTAVHLKAEQYNFDLLLDDHFLLTENGAADTEDFLVVGSRGSHKVSGRLSGRGEAVNGPPYGPLTINLTVEGSLCLQLQ